MIDELEILIRAMSRNWTRRTTLIQRTGFTDDLLEACLQLGKRHYFELPRDGTTGLARLNRRGWLIRQHIPDDPIRPLKHDELFVWRDLIFDVTVAYWLLPRTSPCFILSSELKVAYYQDMGAAALVLVEPYAQSLESDSLMLAARFDTPVLLVALDSKLMLIDGYKRVQLGYQLGQSITALTLPPRILRMIMTKDAKS